MMSPELQARMAEWRRKSLDKSITIEDMKEAIVALRGTRRSAVEAVAASRKSKSKSAPSDKSVDDMLDELEGL